MIAGECTHVYVITDGNYTKIGMAKDPMWRRKTLGGDLHNMQLVRSWYLPGRALEVESFVKSLLKSKRAFSWSFEWFDLHWDEVIETVERTINHIRQMPR